MFLISKNNDSAENSGKAKDTETDDKSYDYFSTGLLLTATVAVFVLIASGITSGKFARGNETGNVFDAMVQTRGCVVQVVDYRTRLPSRYRCDYPVAGQYVDAHTMREEARRVVDARYEKK